MQIEEDHWCYIFYFVSEQMEMIDILVCLAQWLSVVVVQMGQIYTESMFHCLAKELARRKKWAM